MFTPRQLKFIDEFLKDGNAKRAAIAAGYSARTAGQAGPRLAKDCRVVAELKRRRLAKPESAPAADLTPLDFLLSTMRDKSVDLSLRVRAARVAALYVHSPVKALGKKEAAAEAAKTVSGRFKPTEPPPRRFTVVPMPPKQT